MPDRFRSISLPADVPGRLFVHSLPGRYESLSHFEQSARESAISRIVCLVPLEEIRQKSPGYEEFLQRTQLSGTLHHLPIPDFGNPDDHEAFWGLAEEVAEALCRGERVLVHCAAGIGRTGTFATAVLLQLGVPMHVAAPAVESAGSRPETSLQVAFLRGSFVDQKRPNRGQKKARANRNPNSP